MPKQVNSEHIKYRMKVYTILNEKFTELDIWRNLLLAGSSSTYYVGRSPSIPGRPPWYAAVFTYRGVKDESLTFLTDSSLKDSLRENPFILKDYWNKITQKYSDKTMGVLVQEGSSLQLVEVEVLLHHSNLCPHCARHWDDNNEEEANQKLEKLNDELMHKLLYLGELPKSVIMEAYKKYFVLSEE